MRDIPDAKPLTWKGDLAAKMVAGIDKYLRRETQVAAGSRPRRSAASARKELARIIGVVDERMPSRAWWQQDMYPMPRFGDGNRPPDAKDMTVFAQHVRWDVMRGPNGSPAVEAEGLLLTAFRRRVGAVIIAIPDADQTPEMIAGLTDELPPEAQFARRLAEAGCWVLVPTLTNRDCEHSGFAGIMTNQPHREFIYRAAYELGRHIIGYEVQKVLAAVDWMTEMEQPIGVIGYGEGGLIAMYAAALDKRVDVACVSGYFGPREGLFEEPIYRNTWRLLRDFGDAEIAALIAPRQLIVEHCPFPEVTGPPPVTEGRSGAAPGKIATTSLKAVEKEFKRIETVLGQEAPATLVEAPQAGSDAALTSMLKLLGCEVEPDALAAASTLFGDPRPDKAARQKRQFDQLVEHTQALMRESEYTRKDYWAKADATDVKSWVKTTKAYRKRFHEDVIGALPEPDMPPSPRARQVFATEAFTGYEVVLDVYPDVFAYGILLVPKGIPAGERRPVVVCQHGLEGRPQDVADPSVVEPYYKLFACRLAERGFVTFAPQNPYIGEDRFRVLQRMANPLGLSLFSFIIRQHQRILEFLKTLPYVDAKRMAFYGLSYGGKTAMRVPAVLEDYCLSICSGDFNEWIWKNASARHPYSYLRTGEYEMFEFDLGNTFNYAEMSYLICPRPFMVERGHWDGVAPDEWVAYEYAKTRYRYDLLGLQDRTELEFFNGPHEIHAEGTFAFLERHLRG
jgi:dienelactone hydrolase